MTLSALVNPSVLTQPVYEPGKVAGWIAPPDRGINNLPVEYEYVKLH